MRATEPVPAHWRDSRAGGGDGWFLVRLAVTPAAVASARFPATNEEIRTTVEASTDLISLSATELIASYAAREVSPVEVLDAVLARIDDRERVLNAFTSARPTWHARRPRQAQRGGHGATHG